MGFPKMTLQIELVGKTQANIKLIQVTDIFVRSTGSVNTVSTKNDWYFIVGDMFYVNEKTKVVILPKNPNKNIDKLYFPTDKNRKAVLKEFCEALMGWSDDMMFKNKRVFSNVPYIRFFKDMWIIF